MNDELDNIPLLDELIEKGQNIEPEAPLEVPLVDLEAKINVIMQRHTAQAVAEIVAIIDSNKSNNT